MSFGYRVVKEDTEIFGLKRETFKIYEVFYNDKTGEITGWSDESGSALIWEDYNDLKGTVEQITEAFKLPLLLLKDGIMTEID